MDLQALRGPGDPGYHESDDKEAQTDDEKIRGNFGPLEQGARCILKNKACSDNDHDDAEHLIMFQPNHWKKYSCLPLFESWGVASHPEPSGYSKDLQESGGKIAEDLTISVILRRGRFENVLQRLASGS